MSDLNILELDDIDDKDDDLIQPKKLNEEIDSKISNDYTMTPNVRHRKLKS